MSLPKALKQMVRLCLIYASKDKRYPKIELCFLFQIKFIYKYTNITIKLNWKLFTKVFKWPSKGSLGLDRQSVFIRREAQVLLI